MDRFLELYHEHVDGFNGKSFSKARKREMDGNMLWRVKLREKVRLCGAPTRGAG